MAPPGKYMKLSEFNVDNDVSSNMYNPHVPDGWAIKSGGGVANMYHGYYQGPYSTRSTRSDVYGASFPQEDLRMGFKDATADNMYGGVEDSKFNNSRYSPNPKKAYQAPYTPISRDSLTDGRFGNNISYPDGPQLSYTGNDDGFYSGEVIDFDFDTAGTIENFIPDENKRPIGVFGSLDGSTTSSRPFDIIEENVASQDFFIRDKKTNENIQKVRSHPISSLLVIILFFIVVDMWVQTTNYFLKSKLSKGDWNSKTYIWTTAGLTLFLFLIVYLGGFDLAWLETR